MNISYVVGIIPIEMSWHQFISTKGSSKNLTEILQEFYENLVSQPMCHTDLTIYKNPNKLQVNSEQNIDVTGNMSLWS